MATAAITVGLGGIALLSAFHKAGMELMVAARLAGAMPEDYPPDSR